LVGITGTNGKTTTAWLVRDLLNALGETAGYMGTLGFQVPGTEREIPNTTPFPIELYAMLDEAASAGCGSLALEISSHALAQHRADGLSLEVAAFTNFSQDHLDFHHSMGMYAAAKSRLFSEFEVEHRVFNVGDPVGREWWERFGGLGFAIGLEEDLEAGVLWGVPERIGLTEITMAFLEGEQSVYDVRIPLGGAYNVENALAAFACVRKMGYSASAIGEAFTSVRPVPGRFEPVPNEAGIGVIVDYAHTPDALDKLLATARPLVEGRIFTVFGCGGDRDRAKRPLMAQAAGTGERCDRGDERQSADGGPVGDPRRGDGGDSGGVSAPGRGGSAGGNCAGDRAGGTGGCGDHRGQGARELSDHRADEVSDGRSGNGAGWIGGEIAGCPLVFRL
jgi:UDP-N-acetylmuramoyl-L-alanyl-D-glutamate--2,6-diaminopimelate ligase